MLIFPNLWEHFLIDNVDDGGLEERQWNFAMDTVEDPEPTNLIMNTISTTPFNHDEGGSQETQDKNEEVFEYDAPQLFLNSDRIIFNARNDSIFMSAYKECHLGSNQSFTITTDTDFILKAPTAVSIESDIIHLGSHNFDDMEPVVLGDTANTWREDLCNILIDLCTALQAETHPTGCGPSGPPNNAGDYAGIASALQSAIDALPPLLSPQNRTL